MKNNRFYLSGINLFSAIFFLLSACGGKTNDVKTTQIDSVDVIVEDSLKNSVVDAEVSVESIVNDKKKTDFHGVFSAEVQPDGSVYVSFNDEKAEKACEIIRIPYRTGASPYLVEDLDGKCIEVLAANSGNGDNWMLYMLNEDGHIAILSLIDAVSTGNFACSGNLCGFENVIGFKVLTDESATGVYAVMQNGQEKLIEDCDLYGYYFLDGFEIHLTRDWNIYFNAPVIGINSYGKFYIDEDNMEENKEQLNKVSHIVFKMTDKEFYEKLDIETLNPENSKITLYTNQYALQDNKGLVFKRSDYSVLAD